MKYISLFKILSLALLSSMSAKTFAICEEPKIPVHLYILTESSGQGNEHWRKAEYTEPMMKYINEKMLVTPVADLKIVKKEVIKNSRDYHSSQKDLVKRYKDLSKSGAIVVVISREEIVDTGGRAKSVKWEGNPFFVMRSRAYNQDPKHAEYVWKPKNIERSGRLFVHELAHQMDLEHEDSNDSKYSFHTENYTEVAAGKKHYEKFFKHLLDKGGYRCTNSNPVPTPGIPSTPSAPVFVKYPRYETPDLQ